MCVCVSERETDGDGARARGFPTVAGVSEAWLGQRDVFAAPGPLPSPPSPAENDAQPEWKLRFGGQGALCRKLTHRSSLGLTRAPPSHRPLARDFLEASDPCRPQSELHTCLPAERDFTRLPSRSYSWAHPRSFPPTFTLPSNAP